ncbi:hypothetical protein LSPCS325_53700 [Lysinibacillus sp. CTST325]
MDRQEFMDKKKVLFDEFLEVSRSMKLGQEQKDFVDTFYNNFFNSVYDEGAFVATQRVVERLER